jgi:ABC-type bacteriocin/lantibiotic exporter with double-glycine peptidase domain
LSAIFATDTLTFQRAIGEKISTLIVLTSMLITGLAIALYLGWILALVILAYLPILALFWARHLSFKTDVLNTQSEIYDRADSRAKESLAAISLIK